MTFTQFTKLFLLAGVFSTVSAEASVGYILAFDGTATDFELLRGSKPVSVEANKPLEKGDKIRVLKRCAANDSKCANSLILLLGSHEFVTLTYADKTYEVKESKQVSNLLDGFVESLAKWFTDLQAYQVHLVSVHSRGDDLPLSMPLLAGEQTLIAGKTKLYLGWVGGKAPYRVKIVLEGSKKEWTRENLQDTSVMLDNFVASPGRYGVEVKDAKGQVGSQFRIVTETAILKEASAKTGIQHDSLSNSHQTLLASWLVQHAGWRLEAYQRVAGIKGFKPALLVKEGLEGGK